METTEWAEAVTRFDRISPGNLEFWVTWHDGVADRRVPLRPLRHDESRCNLVHSVDAVCCLPARHPGPHVAVRGGPAKLPFVINH